MTRGYFHDRLDGLGVRMEELNSPVDIHYTRGTHTIPVTGVTIGKTLFEEATAVVGTDILLQESRDYIFDYDQIRDVFGVPQPGDIIHEGDLRADVTPFNFQMCYKWTTATRKRIRIHTQIHEDRSTEHPLPTEVTT